MTVAIGAFGSMAASARAANLFTLDPHADSIGPVVVDQSANGYVAWLHQGSPDSVRFCKLAPGARACAHELTLPAAPLLEPPSVTDTPFPVLGPAGYVYVVAPSYDTNQMVMWQSTDGGNTFGPAAVTTWNPEQTSACRVETDLNDVLAFNAYGAEYARSQGTATLPGGSPSGLDFEMSSSNPFVQWTFAFYSQGCAIPLTTTSSPGVLPWQYFAFGGGEVGQQFSTLGWAGGGSSGCALSAAGDQVTAYMQATTPPSVRFYRYSAPSGPCATTGENLSPSASRNWHGPTTVTQGATPRLAGGRAGLFLLSGDEPSASTEAPTAVDIRPYDLASHSFGAPKRLSRVSRQSGLDPDAGGLGESAESGELAAVWPDVGGPTGLMSLFISTDGGARFSAAQQIASVGFGYSGGDDARVAVAADGTGFVTFRDAAGLHVADLNTLGQPYRRLTVRHRRALEVPVTCESPKLACRASAIVKVRGVTIASGHMSVPSGMTETLRLVLRASGRHLLAGHHGPLHATLELTITHPGASSERLTVHTELVG
ncbi:MAG: hypothetical protein KGJ43_03725 [Acidobacteriota bacterium]|nr:hypothetical protein [Acidobacteriota bacterium]